MYIFFTFFQSFFVFLVNNIIFPKKNNKINTIAVHNEIFGAEIRRKKKIKLHLSETLLKIEYYFLKLYFLNSLIIFYKDRR